MCVFIPEEDRCLTDFKDEAEKFEGKLECQKDSENGYKMACVGKYKQYMSYKKGDLTIEICERKYSMNTSRSLLSLSSKYINCKRNCEFIEDQRDLWQCLIRNICNGHNDNQDTQSHALFVVKNEAECSKTRKRYWHIEQMLKTYYEAKCHNMI